MTTPLTEQELLLLAQHRDMVANNRWGELVWRYRDGQLVSGNKNESFNLERPPGNGKK